MNERTNGPARKLSQKTSGLERGGGWHLILDWQSGSLHGSQHYALKFYQNHLGELVELVMSECYRQIFLVGSRPAVKLSEPHVPSVKRVNGMRPLLAVIMRTEWRSGLGRRKSSAHALAHQLRTRYLACIFLPNNCATFSVPQMSKVGFREDILTHTSA